MTMSENEPQIAPGSAPPPSPEPKKCVSSALRMVLHQVWLLCIAWLMLGILSELLRRAGLPRAIALQSFLDSLPLFVIERTGHVESWLNATATGQLTPFWNRLLLSSIGVLSLAIQAFIIGFACVLAAHGLRALRTAHRPPGSHTSPPR